MLFNVVHFFLVVLLRWDIIVSGTVAAAVSKGVHDGVMFCSCLLAVVSLYNYVIGVPTVWVACLSVC